jgi:hypothetical protein
LVVVDTYQLQPLRQIKLAPSPSDKMMRSTLERGNPMTAKTRTSRDVAATPSATVAALFPWAWAAELGRQQLAAATESGSVLLRGYESMRQDFVAAQTELLRGDLPGVARYWQQIAATGFELNSELVDCAIRMVNTEDALAAVHVLHA